MSDERETPASRAADVPETSANPGAPVEESEASHTEVLRAVERAKGSGETDALETPRVDEAADAADAGASGADADARSDQAATAVVSSADVPDAAEITRREVIGALDTEADLASVFAREKQAGAASTTKLSAAEAGGIVDEGLLPSAAAEDTPARDGEIRISADHPMAALYMQSPTPPDLRGNRGAGVLIALVATVGFALVYAGVLALWIAPSFPPSVFLNEGLLPWLTSWMFIAAVAAFFVGLVVIVLIVGRAGWWAYVLGGFFVAALVWFASALVGAMTEGPWAAPGEPVQGFTFDLLGLQMLFAGIGTSVPVIGAALVAREATMWFGAWIGFRGRRVKAKNAEALAEYEAALSEVQAKQP